MVDVLIIKNLQSKSLLYLENNVEKYTKYLYKNSEFKVLQSLKNQHKNICYIV